MKIVPSKRQVPKPIKLIEGIGNGGNTDKPVVMREMISAAAHWWSTGCTDLLVQHL